VGRTRSEEKREEKRSTPPNTHIMAKDETSERRDTQKNMSAQMTCRVPRPRCTKCTRTSLKFLAMRLSPQEPKRRYGLQGTSIQGIRHDKSKRREETQNLPSFDPLAIATTRIKEWNQESDKRRTSEELNPHFTRSMGLRKRGEKKQWNLHPFIQLIMGRAKVGKSEARFPSPNPLVGHHDRATKWHKAILTAHSNAVVITRSKKRHGQSGTSIRVG
jgi:hypothetical protein